MNWRIDISCTRRNYYYYWQLRRWEKIRSVCLCAGIKYKIFICLMLGSSFTLTTEILLSCEGTHNTLNLVGIQR